MVNWCKDADAVTTVVSRKWVVPVLGALTDGPRRHNGLQRAVGKGIHATVLDGTLRHLENAGLVRRDTTPGTPPATWYQLTDLGWSLVGTLIYLAAWVDEHRGELAAFGGWAV
jgi:DNA-binding HxlR family transcriptional regulator